MSPIRFWALPLLGALGCQPPMAIGKVRAEPTEDFPRPWGATADGAPGERGLAETPTEGATGSAARRTELEPRRGAIARREAIAIVIGIEDYRIDVPPAAGAERDAALFADYAEKTLGLSRGNIRLLVATDATKSSIDAVLDEWLTKNLDAGAELFFFFAGHGAPDTQTGRGYLVPWDADPKYIKSQGIAVDDLVQRLATSGAGRAVAFVDACFSGSGGRSLIPEGTRPLVRVKGHDLPSTGATLFAASGPDETTGLAASGHGLFSHHLFAGLNGAADEDRDGAITLAELARYTTLRVRDDAARDNREQEPRLVGQGTEAVLTRLPPQ